MSSNWDAQDAGGHTGPGPQFDQGKNPQYEQTPQYSGDQWSSQGQYSPQGGYPPAPGYAEGYGYAVPADQQYQQGAPAAPLYGYSPVYGSPPVRRSATLGVVALLLVAISAAVLLYTSWVMAVDFREFFLELSSTSGRITEEELRNDPAIRAYAVNATGGALLAGTVSLVGFVGWILSIVATSTNRGRAFGIAGILVGVAALFLVFFVVAAAWAPILSQ